MDWVMFAQNLIYGLMKGAGYLIFASGLSLIFGIMRVMNFAHGELYMLGGMVVYSLTKLAGVPFIASVIISIVSIAVLGFIINRIAIQPVLRISALAPLISTLAISIIILNGSEAIWGTHGKVIDAPFSGIIRTENLAISEAGLMVIIVGLLAGAGLHVFINKSNIGKQMRAAEQNITAATLIGINTKQIYAYTFVISASLAALGGILLGILYTSQPGMGQPLLITGFVVIIVAGMGNLLGASIVAVAIGILEELLMFYVFGRFANAFIYLLLVVVLLLRPQGLFSSSREANSGQ